MKTVEYQQNKKRILGSVSYFTNLDEAALDLVAKSAIRHEYAEGQVVLLEGEPCAGLYIVESGWLKAVKIGLDGREQVLQMLKPGDAFNLISIFTDAPNQATVAALEASQVWVIPRSFLLSLLNEQPSFAQQVVKDLAGRVMHLVRLVEDLSLRSVEARLARLLLEQADGDLVHRQRWATQAAIAARLGTVPDVVNRALRKLAEDGIIAVERYQIKILHQEKLKNIAQLVD